MGLGVGQLSLESQPRGEIPHLTPKAASLSPAAPQALSSSLFLASGFMKTPEVRKQSLEDRIFHQGLGS